ncbi:mercury resistance system transport protein MerF [Chelativorans intermedius]|uniref:Mercury resistance system transport protein MerF n=1 Tax=Chelativorans intermedius TaxID=515947 RepID=A0ABV6DAR7_9HYPH|nr:mercury resistance system transport protein MerF [Chelativorans intermedius]MCT9000146.1 mercury resistance system transport protein MerF [Chelativorans intermedius]
MRDLTIVRTGLAGALVTALCCATPLLVVIFGAAGLSAWLAQADFVLIPLFAMFVGLTACGLWRRRRCRRTAATRPENRVV